MLVKRISTLTGKTHFLDIPISEIELLSSEVSGKWNKDLTSSQMRYLNSGVTDKEWNDQLDSLDKEDESDPDKRYHR